MICSMTQLPLQRPLPLALSPCLIIRTSTQMNGQQKSQQTRSLPYRASVKNKSGVNKNFFFITWDLGIGTPYLGTRKR
jgi:hypothetical protein